MKRAMLTPIATLLCSRFAHAATINIWPNVAAVLNPDFLPADPSLIAYFDGQAVALNPTPGKLILQVDVLMTIDGGTFGNAAFNIALDNLEQSVDLPGWQPDTSTVDKNGNLPGGIVPKWADNGDFGQSGSDLQSIVVGLAPKDFGTAADPRSTLGQNGPAFMGSVFVEIDPVAPGERWGLNIGGVQASQVIDGNLDANGVVGLGGSVSVVIFESEPSSVTLLGLGGALLPIVRRRLYAPQPR